MSVPEFTARERFRRACRCLPVDRPPVWLMRQAGRALPEYRKLKEKHSFLQLVQTPELAAEVTLQPVRRFGFDAAILFSDILVIPEAMGQAYRFRETGGVVMDFAVASAADVAKLSVDRVAERLQYATEALRLVRSALLDQTALIGFAGSPWTLATFMMEGGSAGQFSKALALFREDRKTYYALAEKLTVAITRFLRLQIEAGVDALQIFDSHGGHLPAADFQEASGRWMKDIVAELHSLAAPASTLAGSHGSEHASGSTVAASVETCAKEPSHSALRALRSAVPIIIFSLGTHRNWPDLVATGANVLGVDWHSSLAEVRTLLPDSVALQGNLAPALLSDATPAAVTEETRRLLMEMRGRPGYILNLGHGLPPTAKLENIAALVETVRRAA